MGASGQKKHWRGFTLVEILLVVSILALLVTMGLGHFAVSVEHGRTRGIQSELQSLDARARLLARTEGSVEMRVTRSVGQDGKTYPEVVVQRAIDDEILTRAGLPSECELVWNPWKGEVAGVDPNRVAEIAVDRRGESADVAWSIVHGTQKAAWVVLGSTGETRDLEVSP